VFVAIATAVESASASESEEEEWDADGDKDGGFPQQELQCRYKCIGEWQKSIWGSPGSKATWRKKFFNCIG